MSGAPCKQAMCSLWPHPEHPTNDREAEKIVRAILATAAYTNAADETDPEWRAVVGTLGHTPLTGAEREGAQTYIHKLAEM